VNHMTHMTRLIRLEEKQTGHYRHQHEQGRDQAGCSCCHNHICAAHPTALESFGKHQTRQSPDELDFHVIGDGVGNDKIDGYRGSKGEWVGFKWTRAISVRAFDAFGLIVGGVVLSLLGATAGISERYWKIREQVGRGSSIAPADLPAIGRGFCVIQVRVYLVYPKRERLLGTNRPAGAQRSVGIGRISHAVARLATIVGTGEAGSSGIVSSSTGSSTRILGDAVGIEACGNFFRWEQPNWTLKTRSCRARIGGRSALRGRAELDSRSTRTLDPVCMARDQRNHREDS